MSTRTTRLALVVGLLVPVLLLSDAGTALAASGGIGAVKAFASRLANYVTAVAASIAVLFMAVNGVRFTASNGNPHKQLEARSGLAAAAAGLAVALSANLIVQLVVAALH